MDGDAASSYYHNMLQLLLSEGLSVTRTKLHTVAASNNRDHIS